MEEFFKNSDDYLKILLVTWLKIKDLYLDPKNKSIPLNTRVDNFIKASKIIRKQCKKSHKARKYYHILKYLENEGKSNKEILSKWNAKSFRLFCWRRFNSIGSIKIGL